MRHLFRVQSLFYLRDRLMNHSFLLNCMIKTIEDAAGGEANKSFDQRVTKNWQHYL